LIAGDACIAHGSYDTNASLDDLREREKKAVIPSGPERKKKRRIDKSMHRYRVEVFFHDLKPFRRIATRYEKTAAC
jgi:transposase